MESRRGLTFIEVIISLAILGIVVIVFLTIFNVGNKNILRAGKTTEEILSIQEKIDKRTKNDNYGNRIVKVTIPNVVLNKEIKGRMINVKGDNKIEITTFVPNTVEGE